MWKEQIIEEDEGTEEIDEYLAPRQRISASNAHLLDQTKTTATLIKEGKEGKEGKEVSFDGLVRELVQNRYTLEYKLDRQTGGAAMEILKEYYRNKDDRKNNNTVSERRNC